MIAGFRSVWGALIGSFLVLYLPAASGAMPAALAVPPFGVALLLTVYFMPDGISGLAVRIYQRLKITRKNS